MKSYFRGWEEGETVNLAALEVKDPIPRPVFSIIDQGMVRVCHDIFIRYKGGILLVRRKEDPEKGSLWPIGGRMLRGIPIEESLQCKVKEECGLNLENIVCLGDARVFWRTNPLGHGKGYDAVSINYVATGIGELKLNALHEKPLIIGSEDYTIAFRATLHPYIRDFMDMIFRGTKHEWREYATEGGRPVDLSQLRGVRLSDEDYVTAQRSAVKASHAVFVHYKQGILLAKRSQPPAQNLWYPAAGKLERGLTTQESISRLIKSDYGLDVNRISKLGDTCRLLFKSNPKGKETGYDTLELVFTANAEGSIVINKDRYSEWKFVNFKNVKRIIKEELHPFVKDYLTLAVEYLNKD